MRSQSQSPPHGRCRLWTSHRSARWAVTLSCEASAVHLQNCIAQRDAGEPANCPTVTQSPTLAARPNLITPTSDDTHKVLARAVVKFGTWRFPTLHRTSRCTRAGWSRMWRRRSSRSAPRPRPRSSSCPPTCAPPPTPPPGCALHCRMPFCQGAGDHTIGLTSSATPHRSTISVWVLNAGRHCGPMLDGASRAQQQVASPVLKHLTLQVESLCAA